MVNCRVACEKRGFESRSGLFFFGLDIIKVNFVFLAFIKSPYARFKKKIPSHISIKTYTYRHIGLHVSISYSWVGSQKPLIFDLYVFAVVLLFL